MVLYYVMLVSVVFLIPFRDGVNLADQLIGRTRRGDCLVVVLTFSSMGFEREVRKGREESRNCN